MSGGVTAGGDEGGLWALRQPGGAAARLEWGPRGRSSKCIQGAPVRMCSKAIPPLGPPSIPLSSPSLGTCDMPLRRTMTAFSSPSQSGSLGKMLGLLGYTYDSIIFALIKSSLWLSITIDWG